MIKNEHLKKHEIEESEECFKDLHNKDLLRLKEASRKRKAPRLSKSIQRLWKIMSDSKTAKISNEGLI
jgi:hypothetical protein